MSLSPQIPAIFGFVQDNGSTEEGVVVGTNSGQIYFAVSTNNHPTLDYGYSTCSLANYIDVWMDLTLTYDGTAAKIFVDGQYCGQVLMTGDIKWPSQASWLTVGAYKDVNDRGQGFHGKSTTLFS